MDVALLPLHVEDGNLLPFFSAFLLSKITIKHISVCYNNTYRSRAMIPPDQNHPFKKFTENIKQGWAQFQQDFQDFTQNLSKSPPTSVDSGEIPSNFPISSFQQPQDPTDLQQKWENFRTSTQMALQTWQQQLEATQQKNLQLQQERRKVRQIDRTLRQERQHQAVIRRNEQLKHFFEQQQQEFQKKLLQLQQKSSVQTQTSTQIQVEQDQLRVLEDEKRSQLIQDQQQTSRDLIAKRRLTHQNLQRSRKLRRKQAAQQNQELLKQNWDRFVRIQQRKTERYVKFSNRLWWKGYFNFMIWIVVIVGVLLGIIYLFDYFGINLIALAQKYLKVG